MWVTAQALAALARKPFPLAPVPRARKAAPRRAPRNPARRTARAAAQAAEAAAEAPKAAPAAGRSLARPVDRRRRPTPADLDPTLQKTARAAGWLTAALLAPVT